MPPNDKCILDPERDCIGKAAAIKLEARIENLETEQRKESEFRELYYKERLERAKRDAEMDTKMAGIDEKLDRLLAWQDSQQAQPAKRWDTVIAAIITGVVGFLLARFGM